ncbi:hypothetical protein FNV43_RR10089 [Rhamnella rubrinervis]|uniref:ADP-ribosyl cyclase/cyclic ADP-ribose hydrolase n=1 Tax=Rhamnella rubrinervis TaxID=2594499 RepID=A0A8K0MKD8_9ROSA|nr:hypothetical protein FNV43_RR10089 [Rhamnella rubrinervis]
MAAAASSHPPPPPLDKHDVFISFSGGDTRYCFTSFLYDELRRNQIKAYMDVREFETGDKMSPALEKAIKESKISVIIFSENYVSSTWCLDELVQILKCQKTNGQIVLPVFYQISALTVRNRTDFEAALVEKHKMSFHDTLLTQWREALIDATLLHGLRSKDYTYNIRSPALEFGKSTWGWKSLNGNFSSSSVTSLIPQLQNKRTGFTWRRSAPLLVRKIVDDVWLQLRKGQTSNDLYKGLYGIPKRIGQIERLLSSTDARVIGIYGMGGSGKTTLASAIFQKLYRNFDGYCFIKDVREASAGHRLDELRSKLLTELFKDRAILSVDTPSVVSPPIGDRVRRIKVLIVLDDVDSSGDLDYLIKETPEEFAPGSRIFVTTRDAQVLKNETDQIYPVELLNHSESLDLFHLHAFKNKRPAEDYEKLSTKVVYYANGNPLALLLLAKMLHSKTIKEWESALKKLEKVPNKDIQKVLSISYEELDDMEKDLFLDIACFFSHPNYNEFKRHEVESILDEESTIGISVLNDKSLITIDEDDNVISMHNLLQQMAFAKVCEEDKKPGKRSRLWIAEDISDVLEKASGTATIKSISLHLCDLNKNVKVSPVAFSNMSELQYLEIISHKKAQFKLIHDDGQGPEFSENLRYFCWDFYPYKSFPSGLIPENLVRLSLTDSQLVQLWNEEQAPALEKLKFIDLHRSKNLTQLPNLSRATNIESICLHSCTSLVQVPSYFKDLHKLWYLNLTNCSNLMEVEGISTANNLRRLFLCGTAIEAVPQSIGCLSGLVLLDLHDCTELKILPKSICNLKSLESLDLSGCRNLEMFPEILEPMKRLRRISLRETTIKELPQSSIENLKALSRLDLSRCKSIEFLLNDMCRLRHIYKLDYLDVSSCENLKSIPELPPSLTILDVNFCDNLKSIQTFPPSLTTLDASDCKSLEKISSWRTPPIQEQRCSSYIRSDYAFHNCQKLDYNTRNYIIPRGASAEILSVARSMRKWKCKCDRASIVICYPGDNIPDYFTRYESETTINIDLHPNWCNANFLGFAFSFILDLGIASEKVYDHLNIECVLSFMNGGVGEDPYKVPVKWKFPCSKLNSDHVLILYDHDLSCKKLQKNFGENWSSICNVTKASFDFGLSLLDIAGFKNSGFRKSKDWSIKAYDGCHKSIIKKCGVWFIYDQEEEGTKHFAQLSQVDGGSTHEVVCLGDDKADANTAAAERETKRVRLSQVSGASTSTHEVVRFVDDKVNITNTEEEESHPNTSA